MLLEIYAQHLPNCISVRYLLVFTSTRFLEEGVKGSNKVIDTFCDEGSGLRGKNFLNLYCVTYQQSLTRAKHWI
jgi:hypothetical protein